MRQIPFLAALAAALLTAAPAGAEPWVFTTPHLSAAAGPVAVSFEGATFVNQGLVAVGRLPADTLDFAGETLGSFSGMAADPAAWRRLPDGTYRGRILTLPDRGPNDVGGVKGTSDYRGRVQVADIALDPRAAAPSLAIRPAGGFFLRDATDKPFTGKDPGAGALTRDGVAYPSPATGEGAGRISLDPEAMAALPDGSFYVSDEYAAAIYYFDRSGRQIGFIPAVNALTPRRGGVVNFGADRAPDTGRRNNQGLEALAVSPDGRRLITILQSAAVQDAGHGAQTRNNTRILVYDISAGRTPRAPVGHYVLQLPAVSLAGAGGAPDATAAQSEMLALNDHQFLVLARDSVGRGGDKGGRTPVFKSVLLVDVSGATNLAGRPAETEPAGAVAPGGVLDPAIVPARKAELVNLLAPAQLARFGMNLDLAPSGPMSLPEKWESMALLPARDPAAPNDVFLLIGNDNDFVAGHGRLNGQAFDGSLAGAKGSGEVDNMILVYRLTLPGPPRR